MVLRCPGFNIMHSVNAWEEAGGEELCWWRHPSPSPRSRRSLDDLPANAHPHVVRRALPHLRDLLRSLDHFPTGVAVFLSDLLSHRRSPLPR
ncbi:Os12g0404760 [Oryza sativa Japonica Group]|nr:Os12g0404760 [Oryza sativa Japonica Group]